jgi:hypothetical protein
MEAEKKEISYQEQLAKLKLDNIERNKRMFKSW